MDVTVLYLFSNPIALQLTQYDIFMEDLNKEHCITLCNQYSENAGTDSTYIWAVNTTSLFFELKVSMPPLNHGRYSGAAKGSNAQNTIDSRGDCCAPQMETAVRDTLKGNFFLKNISKSPIHLRRFFSFKTKMDTPKCTNVLDIVLLSREMYRLMDTFHNIG